jgi:hypothetical protein
MQRNVTGTKFERTECKENHWTSKHKIARGKFRLSDAINVKFNAKYLSKYDIARRPFVVKCDAIDKDGIPVEIKKSKMITLTGKKLAISFAEYLSIKNYRDVYKLICEKMGYNYVYYQGKRKRITFDTLYKKHAKIERLEDLKVMDEKRKKLYYRWLVKFCQDNGVTEMFNNFVASKQIIDIFAGWIKNYRNKDFYLDCKDGIYHSSYLTFSIKLVKAHWGFNRVTVFVKLNKKLK